MKGGDAMPKVEIRQMGFECLRCGRRWIPKVVGKKPLTCPKCRSPYWDKPVEREGVSESRKKKS